MTGTSRRLRKGDDVEIKFATHDGYIWLLATVVYVNADGMTVQYPSGHERFIDHDHDGYRRPERRQCQTV